MTRTPKNLTDLLLEYFDFVVKFTEDILALEYIDQSDIQRALNEHNLLMQRVGTVSTLPKEFKARLATVHLSAEVRFLPISSSELKEKLRYMWLNMAGDDGRRFGDEQCFRDRLIAYGNQMSHFRFALENMVLE